MGSAIQIFKERSAHFSGSCREHRRFLSGDENSVFRGTEQKSPFFAGEEFVFGGAQQIGLVGVGRVWLFWEQHSLVLFVDYRKETFCVEGMFGLWDLSWSAVAS